MQSTTLQALRRVILSMLVITIIGSSISCGQSSWRKPDALYEAMDIKEGSWVADVGGGDGDYTVRMSSIVKDSGHIFTVDIDQDKLEDLHQALEEWDAHNVTPVYSVPGDPMLPENTLDAILIRNAYHEFRNYMDMLAHMKKSLKSGGRLVMAEPMEQEVVGASREEQMDDHSLAMKYAVEDLKNAGFDITKKVNPFTSNDHQRYWMLIAKKPS